MSRREEFETVEFHPDELGHLSSRDFGGKLRDMHFHPGEEHDEKVQSIKAAIEAGEEMPPIEIGGARTGKRYLHDGHHRYVAARELGLPIKVRGYYG